MLIKLIKILIGGLLIYIIVKNNVIDFSVFKKIDFPLTFKIITLIILIAILGSFKWYILLKVQNSNIKFKEAFEAYYFGYSLNYILFGLAGDVAKTILIIQERDNKIGLAMSVAIDRLLGFFSMIFIVILFLPYILLSINYSRNIGDLFLANIILYNISIFFALLIFLLFFNKFLNSRRLNIKLIKFLRKYKSKIVTLTIKILKSLFTYRKSIFIININLFLAFVIQIIITLCLFIISFYISFENSGFINQLISSVIVQILSVIPISPGNIGVSEIAFSEIMFLLNNNITLQYASIYLLFRFFNMLFSIPSVLLYFIAFKSKK